MSGKTLAKMALLPLFLCASCSGASSADTSSAEITALRSDLNTLRAELTQRTYDPQTTAWLTPTEKGFALINTGIGPIAFAVEDIQPKGDGSELTLKIGNLSGATILSLKFHAEWGSIGNNDMFVDGSSRDGDKEVTSSLLPGAWNTVTLAFAGVPPAKLGRVEISKPEVTNISLRPL